MPAQPFRDEHHRVRLGGDRRITEDAGFVFHRVRPELPERHAECHFALTAAIGRHVAFGLGRASAGQDHEPACRRLQGYDGDSRQQLPPGLLAIDHESIGDLGLLRDITEETGIDGQDELPAGPQQAGQDNRGECPVDFRLVLIQFGHLQGDHQFALLDLNPQGKLQPTEAVAQNYAETVWQLPDKVDPVFREGVHAELGLVVDFQVNQRGRPPGLAGNLVAQRQP